MPLETAILIDEAYHHYVDSPEYERVVPLIREHRNLIVARTFSKIYGMAGMRCGYCIAQPPTIERMRPHQLNDGVNITLLLRRPRASTIRDNSRTAFGSTMKRVRSS